MLNGKSRQVHLRPLSRESYRDIARSSSLRDVQDTAASMLPYVGRNHEQPKKLAVWHLLVASCRLTCSIQRVAGGKPETFDGHIRGWYTRFQRPTLCHICMLLHIAICTLYSAGARHENIYSIPFSFPRIANVK